MPKKLDKLAKVVFQYHAIKGKSFGGWCLTVGDLTLVRSGDPCLVYPCENWTYSTLVRARDAINRKVSYQVRSATKKKISKEKEVSSSETPFVRLRELSSREI